MLIAPPIHASAYEPRRKHGRRIGPHVGRTRHTQATLMQIADGLRHAPAGRVVKRHIRGKNEGKLYLAHTGPRKKYIPSVAVLERRHIRYVTRAGERAAARGHVGYIYKSREARHQEKLLRAELKAENRKIRETKRNKKSVLKELKMVRKHI